MLDIVYHPEIVQTRQLFVTKLTEAIKNWFMPEQAAPAPAIKRKHRKKVVPTTPVPETVTNRVKMAYIDDLGAESFSLVDIQTNAIIATRSRARDLRPVASRKGYTIKEG